MAEPIHPGEEIAFMGANGLKSEMNRGQLMWKWTTEYALGWTPKVETMQAFPLFYSRWVYPRLRQIMNMRHGNWEEYILGCRNEFPQTFCEFNALGAVARADFHSDYHWWELKSPIEFKSYPPCRGHVIQSWSHGGPYRIHDYATDGEGVISPAYLFTKLGIV